MPNLLYEIGVIDIVDITLVSVLLYATLAGLRRTRGAFVVIGILILGGIYALAQSLGLQLTAWIFQGFFAIFLIIIVVIFQEELKQLFERLAVLSLRRGRDNHLDPRAIDTLVACLAEFARTRTGALIVVPGNDPIERHVNGGIELNGRLSEPLLRSLFDPHSPGHDGAAVLQGERITRFAAQLPLSKDFTQLARMGTRHSAALGLAEQTDALCLVVSEESGTISVAEGGRLRRLSTEQEAGYVVQQFLREKRPRREGRRAWREILLLNWHEKAAAIVMTATLWFLFVPGSKTSVVTLQVPVEVENLPSGLEIESVEPEKVKVTFAGVRRAFYLFEPKTLQVTIDASLASLGRRTFRVTEQNLKLPRDVTLEQVQPPSVRISLRKPTPP